jgi:hypothetical protein
MHKSLKLAPTRLNRPFDSKRSQSAGVGTSSATSPVAILAIMTAFALTSQRAVHLWGLWASLSVDCLPVGIYTLDAGMRVTGKVTYGREGEMSLRKVKLTVVAHPGVGHVVSAPPPIKLSSHTTYYQCGSCETVLLISDPGQIHGILIHCKECGSYNEPMPLSEEPAP